MKTKIKHYYKFFMQKKIKKKILEVSIFYNNSAISIPIVKLIEI